MVPRNAIRFARLGFVPVLIVAVVLLIPGVASATSGWRAVSGTTWSDSNRWFTSSLYRTVDGPGCIWTQLWFSQLPVKSNGTVDQIKWRLIDNDGSILRGDTYYIGDFNSHNLQVLCSGRQFRNSFARYTTCQVSGCNHDFAAIEYY